MIATGVARPSAQGQLTTSTAIPLASAYPNGCPTNIQISVTITAIMMTIGTNIPDTLSAILAIGALVAAASLTILIICDRVVSSPTRVALALINPVLLIVAAETSSPIDLSTGTLSPVSADSSIAVPPSIITPSTGMLSPGLTTKTSPVLTSAI